MFAARGARLHFFIIALIGSSSLMWGGHGLAQELEAGLYQNAPLGMNAAFAGYTYSTGNILFDASLPIEGAHARTNTVVLGYLRTMRIFDRSAKVDVQLPVAWGTFDGFVAGVYRTRSPSGLADPRFRLTVNLVGAPALEQEEFASYRQRTILGATLQVVVPVGQYDPERFINLGANRWSFRSEVGLSRTRKRWFVEAVGGAWLFTKNSNFYGGSSLAQRPLYFLKGDVLRTFKRGLWAAFNYGIATGGETSVDDAPAVNSQTNNRLAATLALPVARATSFQLKFTSGLTTRLGADFDSYGALIQYSWGS